MQDGLLYSPLIVGPLALIVALALYFRIKSLPDGNETMNRIGTYVREGAMAFLTREYKVLFVYSLVVMGFLAVGLGAIAALSFLLGAFLSLLAGFFGMKAATYANVRTAQSAREGSKPNALLTALDGGAVMGLSVAGLGLIGLGALFLIFRGSGREGTVLHAFAVGASSIALFARIGGGIYTKAADVGADIAGKVIENIPEDDPRNPGVIADNVGDNVGDVAGMGADIYESMVAAIVSAMAIALTVPSEGLSKLGAAGGAVTGDALRAWAVSLPLLLSTLGLVISLVVVFIARAMKNGNPASVLRNCLLIPPVLLTVASAVLMPMFGDRKSTRLNSSHT